ncbi:MAG: sigma-54-dependent Fis family transcriptional regulator [Ignavibacteria bacterium CG22_combo_CG10-13_8_21_14_all_37_15]|nr:MAG: sigma-54-dependent Fis family transcriptional regulator [Ignavibacteria bacterium CG22_combo_CG10-13_8_21_14_all_37_15]
MDLNNNKNNVILNSLAEGVITVDKDFKITFFNEAAGKITGFERDKVIGNYCKNIFKSEFCFTNCPIANVLQNGKNVYDVDTSIQCNNSEPVSVRLNAAILKDEDNYPIGGVISFRDVTILKKIESILSSDNLFIGMIGTTKEMQEIFRLIEEIAASDVPVFIHGETGVGKELIANAIQTLSKRKTKNFVKVNCSVIPQNLLASELFGHVKGAFTDAHKDRIGRFEYADKGTIFLDEIGELPLQMQPQLLRVIESGSFERVGETITKNVDVRIISATNITIDEAIKNGKFRKDLYYRLNVVPIEIPPLRNRKEDIPFLANHFIKKYSLVYQKKVEGIDEDALDLLITWNWPGNVRELENVIEYALIKTKREGSLCICCLPKKIRGSMKCTKKNKVAKDIFDTNNAELIDLLNQHKWNKSKVAEALGIDRTTLWRKLKSIGVN